MTDEQQAGTTLRGFGFRLDVERGTTRQWYSNGDGVMRWADNDQPVGRDATPAPEFSKREGREL